MELLKQIDCCRSMVDTMAYIHNDQQISYHDLVRKSNILADYLQNTLQEDYTPIPVYGHKDPLMMVCFLACVKSGRAYCPIDTGIPQNRSEAILDAVQSNIILTSEPLETLHEGVLSKADIEHILATHEHEIGCEHHVKEEDVFYIIFTSGSSGTPKGVQITYHNLNCFLDWSIPLAKAEQGHKTFINQAPFSFDLSVMDVYCALGSAGTIYALDKDVQKNYQELYKALGNSQANVWVSTPSFADMCLIDKTFSTQLLPNIEVFLFCGEILTNETAKKLLERFPDAEVINTYGPTESTVAVSDVVIDDDILNTCNPLPIGRSKPGTFLRILDEAGKELADLEKGEIVIIGDTVGKGYFKNPEHTSKVFVPYLIDGQTYPAYHTGDKGYLDNGMLYYSGRIDLQIKLNGYRIEIPDIEQNLLKVDMVANAVVLPKYKDGKIKNLVAYVVYLGDTTERFKVGQKIAKELKGYVPDYMVPKKFIFLDTMPTTNNGKADRRALAEAVE